MNGIPILGVPNVKFVSLRDVMQQIHNLLNKIPGIAVVIIAGRKGEFENMSVLSNSLPFEMRREMVARVHNAFTTGTNVPE